MEAKIVPDGLHINYSKDKPVCLMHDGEIVAWIAPDGKFEHLGEVRVVRAVERILRHNLETFRSKSLDRDM